mgnify:CR=1 FL=1
MQKSKLFSSLLSLGVIAISIVSCDSKNINAIENLYKTEANSENESDSEIEEVDSKNDSNLSSDINVNNINAVLDEYEKTVNQYNDYKERISEGDISVIAEAPALLEKIQDWKNKIEKSKAEMTPEQVKRMSDIISNM